MAKRNAGNDLNSDNWDAEEEPEDAGRFKKASEDEIKNRVIKTARRRNIGGSSGNNEISTKAIFGSFTGFKTADPAKVTETAKASPFSFLSNINATSKPVETSKQEQNTISLTTNNSTPTNNGKSDNSNDKNAVYLSKLKGLNQAFLQWITKHVTENPICILTPTLRDYDDHLKKIQDESKSTTPSPAFTNNSAPLFSSTPASNAFKLDGKPFETTKTSSQAATPAMSTFSFSSNIAKQPEKTDGPKLSGIFSIDTANNPTSFFGNSKPFSFGNVAAPPPSDKPPNGNNPDGENEDDEDQPPKVEFTPSAEEGSVFSKKCKIFIKKDATFTDRGVATLHIKIIEEKKKIQVLARANTPLGTVLLNVLLTPSFPLQKMKKNNILLICLPTPDAQPPPTSVLIRLQSEDIVDEVLSEIKKLIPSNE